jgi:hypothetical protein
MGRREALGSGSKAGDEVVRLLYGGGQPAATSAMFRWVTALTGSRDRGKASRAHQGPGRGDGSAGDRSSRVGHVRPNGAVAHRGGTTTSTTSRRR